MDNDALVERILNSLDDILAKMDGIRQENDKWHQMHDSKDAAEFTSVRDMVGKGLGDLRDRIVRVEPIADHMDMIGEFSKEIELRLNKLESQSRVDSHFYKELNDTMKGFSKDLMPRVQKLENYHETAKSTAEAIEKLRLRFEKRLQWLIALIITMLSSEMAIHFLLHKA